MSDTIKVLVVDDSAVVRDFLVYIISSEPDMHVVGTAKNGKEAVKLAMLKKPDIITMDIEMPVMNGYEATQTIMSTHPVPIVVVTSSYSRSEVEKTFKAIDAGALAILAKPGGFKHPKYLETKTHMINTIRAMAGVKVITRLNKYGKNKSEKATKKKPVVVDEKNTKYQLIAIGVSTGGPQILNLMLPLLPTNFKLPICIVQHIPVGFLEGMVEWLSKSSKLKIKIAEQGEKLDAGTIYFCPPDFNMGISKDMQIELVKDVPFFTVKPSVSYMFRTINKNIGKSAAAILLSGMGKDGAEELALMKENGVLTIIQDKETSVVYGMPGEAAKLGAFKYILPPEKIIEKLIELNK